MKPILQIAAGIVLGYVGVIVLNVFVLAPFALWLARAGIGV